MISFKQFLEAEAPIQKWEDILHHIAEEELISCKVFSIELVSSKEGQSTIKMVADCNDKPRELGHQPDLSDKVTERLKLHKLPGLGSISVKVHHRNVDTR